MNIIHDPKKCISCGNCVAICPKVFEFKNNKVLLIGGKKNQESGKFEKDIDKVECIKDAADICPVRAIEVK